MCLHSKALCGFFTLHDRQRSKIFSLKRFLKRQIKSIFIHGCALLFAATVHTHGCVKAVRLNRVISVFAAILTHRDQVNVVFDQVNVVFDTSWAGWRHAWSKPKWWMEINSHVGLWSCSVWCARILIKCWCQHKVTPGLCGPSHTCRQSLNVKEETSLQTCHMMSVRQYWQYVLLIEDNFDFEEV